MEKYRDTISRFEQNIDLLRALLAELKCEERNMKKIYYLVGDKSYSNLEDAERAAKNITGNTFINCSRKYIVDGKEAEYEKLKEIIVDTKAHISKIENEIANYQREYDRELLKSCKYVIYAHYNVRDKEWDSAIGWYSSLEVAFRNIPKNKKTLNSSLTFHIRIEFDIENKIKCSPDPLKFDGYISD